MGRVVAVRGERRMGGRGFGKIIKELVGWDTWNGGGLKNPMSFEPPYMKERRLV